MSVTAPEQTTIPDELRSLAQWVVYRAEKGEDGKTTKRPYQPRSTRTLASSTTRATWSSFETAIAATERDTTLNGVGFVFTAQDPYMGIDLDHCITDGVISRAAQKIIDQLDSYSEFSPSGDGIHVIVKASVPRGRKDHRIEMYSEGRYFTMPGRHVPGTPLTINERQDAVDALYARFFPEPEEQPAPMPSRPNTVADRELLERAFSSRNGEAIRTLYLGDTKGHAGDDSAADLALCNHLAFYTGRDAARMDALFRASGLMRKKWDERHGKLTYGQMTIQKAIEATRETYSPSGNGVHAEGTFGRMGEDAPPEVDPETGEIRERARAQLEGRVDLWPYMSGGVREPDWVINGILVAGMIALLHGEPGCGKTILALAFARYLVRQGIPVVFIDEESGPTLVAQRLILMGLTEEEVALIHYYPFAGITLADADALVDRIEEIAPGAVFFDSMADVLTASDLDENAATDVTRWMVDVAVRIARRTSCTPAVVILDHNTKSQETVKYARGSGAKKAKSDIAFFINKVAEFDADTLGRVRLERTKNRPGYIPESILYVVGGKDGELICEPFDISRHEISLANEVDMKALDALEKAGAEGLQNGQLQGIVGLKKTAVAEMMTRLEKAGHVARTGAGPATKYLFLNRPANDLDRPANDARSSGESSVSAPLIGGERTIPNGWTKRRIQNSEGEWE